VGALTPSGLPRRALLVVSLATAIGLSLAYVAGDIRSHSSMFSHIGPPNCCSKIQNRSLEPNALTIWLTARSESAA